MLFFFFFFPPLFDFVFLPIAGNPHCHQVWLAKVQGNDSEKYAAVKIINYGGLSEGQAKAVSTQCRIMSVVRPALWELALGLSCLSPSDPMYWTLGLACFAGQRARSAVVELGVTPHETHSYLPSLSVFLIQVDHLNVVKCKAIFQFEEAVWMVMKLHAGAPHPLACFWSMIELRAFFLDAVLRRRVASTVVVSPVV